ncbi:MAG: hypothetical protein PsegKO_06760 [Pseudohongiellaceae bacterium]
MIDLKSAVRLFVMLAAGKQYSLACLATGLVLLCAPVAAQDNTEFPQPQVSQHLNLQQQQQRYQRAVQALDGSHDEGSAELYRALANIQQQQGDYDAAITSYSEALQALRINQGLASEPQLELLAAFNDVLYRKQQWQRLDTHYHLAHQITTQLYGSDDPRSIAAATQLASWKIRAWQAGVYRPRGDRSVQDAAAIYRGLLTSLEDSDRLNHQQRATLLSAQGLAYFYAARHVANIPVSEFQYSAPVHNSLQQCVPLVMSVDGAQPSASACHANQNLDPEYYAAQQREKNNTVRRHLADMRQSFSAAIEALQADPDASLEQRVQAVLHLGDANLLAEDYRRARRQYAQAWAMLSNEPQHQALRQRLLDQPVRALQGILDSLPFDAPLAGTALLGSVSFEVTETGAIENISINGPPEALSQDNLGEIAIKLDQSVYRPRIQDGQPVRGALTLPASAL